MFTRRTATVTISAPDAACAWAITGNDGYFPVPTMRRDSKVRPAMTKGVSVMVSWCSVVLPAPDEVDDFNTVAVLNDRRLERVALEDPRVVLHRHTAWIDRETVEQIGYRQRLVDIEGVAVQRYAQL